MDLHLTPENAKNRFMEWSNLNQKHQAGFTKVMDPQTLEDFSLFDTTAVFFGGVNGADYSDLSTVVKEYENETAREQYLTKALGRVLLNKSIKEKVDELIDGDIKDKGIHSPTTNILNKAFLLSDHNVKESLKFVEITKSQRLLPEEHEFCVILTCLYGGWAQQKDILKLYFDFETSFYEFFQTLQEQTRFCVIPPKAIVKYAETISMDDPKPESLAGVNYLEHDALESAAAFPDTSLFSISPSATTIPGSQNEAQSQYLLSHALKAKKVQTRKVEAQSLDVPLEYQPRRGPRETSEKGYSLRDGPWEYCLLDQTDGDINGTRRYAQIYREHDYRQMLAQIRDSELMAPDRYKKVYLVHSLDNKAMQEWSIERNARRNAREDWKEEFIYEDEDIKADPNWGETPEETWEKEHMLNLRRGRGPS